MRDFKAFGCIRRGFTLIEILVVVVIIAVLLALTLPAIQMAREASRSARCSNNLRQIGLGMHSYVGAVGALPPAGSYDGLSAFALILPQLDQANLYNSINHQTRDLGTAVGGVHETAVGVSVSVFLCPS